MFNQLKLQLSAQGQLNLTVRVHPNAKRTGLKAIMADNSLKLDIAAAPEDGQANAAMVKFLAKEFGVKARQIDLISGQSGRLKKVVITT